MKFTTATIAAASLTLASAAALARDNTPIADGDSFNLQTMRAGSDFQFGRISAFQRSLHINNPNQGANCPAKKDPGIATFYLQTGNLFLKTPGGAPAQQLFVDRSAAGQGLIQYTTGTTDVRSNQERGPFALDGNGVLTFVGQSTFLACPSTNPSGYSVWLSGVAQNPGNNQGCVPFITLALKNNSPTECTYTSS